ncbi:MAG TPA: hypothetical protein VM308_01990 [Sphingomicrobium sp.]|nr:hypothetical protein [Sphingomicrobium sp.]
MRVVRMALITAALAWPACAQAATIVIFVEPMTLEKYTRVIDTPGRDRVLLCMQPPSLSGCTEIPLTKRR